MKARFVRVLSMIGVSLLLMACEGSDGLLLVPSLELISFQKASVVIGQPDFTSNLPNQGGGVAANTIRAGYGSAGVYNGRLYVPDPDNHRILGFNSIPATNNASADFVIGQTDMTSADSGDGANQFYYPRSVRFYGDMMFVVDTGNARILIWNTVPVTNTPADLVVGQTDFGNFDSGCSATVFNNLGPEGFDVADGRLIVADTYNHRILIWNTIPTTNGVAADTVIGQNDFTTCTANMGGGVSASGFILVTDVVSDGNFMAAADYINNRVLIWNTIPNTNTVPADIVIGQPDMTSSAWGTAADRFRHPYYLATNGKQLAVAEYDNHRVLIYDTIPTVSGAAADAVLGQGDFTHATRNDDDQDNVEDAGPSARTMSGPSGVGIHKNMLIVSDWDNARVLIFE